MKRIDSKRRELDKRWKSFGGVIAYAKHLRDCDRTFREIAQELGVSEATAHRLVNSEKEEIQTR